jgi:hypothetical protein
MRPLCKYSVAPTARPSDVGRAFFGKLRLENAEAGWPSRRTNAPDFHHRT